LKPDVTTVSTCVATIGTNLLHRSVYLKTHPPARADRRAKPNGFWLDSFSCQRAGTPRPAGRTTDNRQLYRFVVRVSTEFRSIEFECMISPRARLHSKITVPLDCRRRPSRISMMSGRNVHEPNHEQKTHAPAIRTRRRSRPRPISSDVRDRSGRS